MSKQKLKALIAKNIKLLRKYRGLSGEGLGKKVGCSRAFICKIETGKVNPSIEMLDKLAHALEVDPHKLLDKIN